MNETLRGLWTRVVDRWKAMSPNMRRNLIIIVVAALALLSSLIWIVSRPDYVTVMTGLDDKSLGQVQTQLEQLKIPNKIDGSSVLVPKGQADEARVQLAEAGLPSSGYIGYSNVGGSIGETQDQFNIQVLDALQQSLNETISSINGVESAQVHIVMPQQQLFVSQQTQDAKASVLVQLGSGVQLTSQQVAGIQQLVSHAVTGLSVGNVTVVDQNGDVLSSANSSSSATGSASSEMQMRQQLENDMTQKLSSGLDQILGPGNAVVVVHANVTFNQKKSNSHTLQNAPGQSNGYVTSQQTNRTQSSSPSTTGGAAGQAGSNPNNPTTYAGTSGGTGNSTSSQSQSTTNYSYSYTNSSTTSDPMQIQGYSVGVFVNKNDKSINAAEVKQIKAFASNLIGQSANSTTNRVTVSRVPFTQAAQTSTVPGKSHAWWYAAIALALLLLGGLALWRRRKTRASSDITDVAARIEDAYEPQLEELPPTEEERLQSQLAGMARERPDDFASLLRSWLSE